MSAALPSTMSPMRLILAPISDKRSAAELSSPFSNCSAAISVAMSMFSPNDNGSKTKKDVALIVGPTASGKSALALQLAKKQPSVIINADSAQVYADLRILSARPSEEEMAGISHRLYGYIDGAE